MGLREAFLELAADMERKAEEWAESDSLNNYSAAEALRGYAKGIRWAVKAGGDAPHQAPLAVPQDPAVRRAFEKASEAAERLAAGPTAGQMGGDRMWECEGGPLDGVTAPAASQLPEGAFTKVGDGLVYRRVGGVLVYDQAQTERLRGGVGNAPPA